MIRKNKVFSFKGFIFVLALAFLFTSLIAQTPPEKFLGFKVGADRKLADYNQIMGYFKKLDQESEKIKVVEIGYSTLKKPMIMAIITSEKNMEKLEYYKEIARKLKDPRVLSPEEAKKLVKEGKVIVLITCNIHSTEIGSAQMSMELAYKLVTGDTPFPADKVLNDVIVLLIPTTNPDGEQMVVEWYRKYLGTEYEGGRMPWLYHHYAGHDDNRDWFMFNLAETRAVSKVLYHEWFPQIHIDEHQMGSTGARLFLPPFMDPPERNIHPLMWRSVALLGMSMAYDLEKQGFKGVVHGRSFTGWWIGACDDTSWLHNVVGILSEMASVKIATPIYIEPNEIPKSYAEKWMNFPDPWPGGWWRLRDIVEYELALTLSLIKTAYLHKEDFLFNFYKMCKDACEIREPGEPYAFVIPKEQHDYPTTLRMLDILMFGGVEIHQAEEDFVADGKKFSKGSFVVLMSQPYKPYAKALLEKQKYPEMREYEGGPPIPPYDNAGWTLPLQMGVKCEPIKNPFSVKLKKLEKPPWPEPSVPADSPYLALDSRINNSYALAFALLKNKVKVFRSKEAIKLDSSSLVPGSFIFKNTSKVRDILNSAVKKWYAPVYSLKDISKIKKAPLKYPRIGLYQSWASNMDEGWTRYVFDDLGVPYKTLHNKDFKNRKKGLKEDFDVIVFASEDYQIIKEGQPRPGSRWARYFTPLPPEYRGGIGKKGIEALKKFVEEGGILVTLNQACELAFKEFKVPASNATERLDRTKFFCPTSILRIKVDPTTPIGYGMPEEAAAMFARSLAMNTWIPSGFWNRKVVARYPEDNILLSGWLLGEDKIARKAAVVDTQYKKGRIILIGIRCQHRAQTHGTYKFLLNALLYPEF